VVQRFVALPAQCRPFEATGKTALDHAGGCHNLALGLVQIAGPAGTCAAGPSFTQHQFERTECFMRVLLKVAVPAAAMLCLASAPALAGMDGEWRCKSSFNIPIALLYIDGTSYSMVGVSNSTWKKRSSGSSNGEGELDIQGNTITPLSGPLLDVYHAQGSYCDPSADNCSAEYIGFISPDIPLGCWRDG
jgi:hypothetical protein